jgi:hypothetical protein
MDCLITHVEGTIREKKMRNINGNNDEASRGISPASQERWPKCINFFLL